MPPGDPEVIRRGSELASRAVGRFLDAAGGKELPPFHRLPEGERRVLRGEIGEAFLMMARARQQQAEGTATEGEQNQAALALAEKAEAFFAGDAPPALFARKASLLDKLNRREEAKALRGATRKPRCARDFYLGGLELAAAHRWREALPLLKEAARLDPSRFAAWWVLGACQDDQGKFLDAIASFNAMVALRPDHAGAWFSLSLARMRAGALPDAERDFDEAIRLDEDMPQAWTNRGIVRHRLGREREALADLDEALGRGGFRVRVALLRAQLRGAAGDKEGAKDDTAAAFRRPAVDADDHVARGAHLLATKPRDAMPHFEAALRLNPWSFEALSNKAMVLAEVDRDLPAALKVLDSALARYPDSTKLLGGRAVYRARLGRRDLAHADARACLERDAGPAMLYQIACVYSLTTPKHPDDSREALRLFATALRNGFDRFDLVANDRDMDPVRGLPEFARVLRAAAAYRAALPLREPNR